MSQPRSTFPLDRPALIRSALREILTDPISWVPLLPPVALYTFFDPPGWMPIVLGGGVAAGLGGFWMSQWASVIGRQQQLAIRAHNAEQDRGLEEAAAQFGQDGHHAPAAWLRRFLALKRKVENRIHENGELNAQKIQVERLIDSLCFEARDQLLLLVKTDSQDFATIQAAYETLDAATAQIDSLLGPGETLPGSSNLEEITSRLREETDLARRVQERLKSASSEPLFQPPENRQSE